MNADKEPVAVRPATIEDLPRMIAFWNGVPGLGLNERDDTPEGLARVVARTPGLSCVAEVRGQLVGTLLGGHDGRRAMLYHVCVSPEFRGTGIGRALIEHALSFLRSEGITKCQLVCFRDNDPGNAFWAARGWVRRDDLHVWQMPLIEPEART